MTTTITLILAATLLVAAVAVIVTAHRQNPHPSGTTVESLRPLQRIARHLTTHPAPRDRWLYELAGKPVPTEAKGPGLVDLLKVDETRVPAPTVQEDPTPTEREHQ